MAYSIDENGNYKRTVRCSQCYQVGHNKGSCVEYRKKLKTNIERYNKALEDDSLSTWDRECNERYLRNSTDTLAKLEGKGKSRSCGYCHEVGHSRPTCTTRKQEVSTITASTLEFRKKVAQRMIDENFGPGALVEVGSGPSRLAVVTKVALDEVATSHKVQTDSHFFSFRAVHVRYVVPFKQYGREYQDTVAAMPLHFLNTDDHARSAWFRNPSQDPFTVLSTVDTSEASLVGDSLDESKVKKWVLENIVDPK
tara:strand:+ start:224 stop:982 length:759 start_codon:yes stop_codon:yes gene_type:complete